MSEAKPKRPPRPKRAVKRSSGAKGVAEAGLTDAVRQRVVVRLAMFDRVSDIQKDLLEEGIDISAQAISYYSPLTNQKCADKWSDLFFATRKDFLQEIAEEPIAHRAYRLRVLDRVLHTELKRGNTVGARETLEQAAKEVGDVFTNVTKGAGRIEHAHVHMVTTLDEKRNMLADRLREAIEKKALPAPKEG